MKKFRLLNANPNTPTGQNVHHTEESADNECRGSTQEGALLHCSQECELGTVTVEGSMEVPKRKRQSEAGL